MFQGDVLSADLADMRAFKTQNDDFCYILFVIDTFSKMGYGCGIKRKTAEQPLKGFQKIKKILDIKL